MLLAFVATTGCRDARDAALDRGATVVMAVANVGVMKPDEDLDFLTFLPLATLDEHGELEGRLARSWEHSADFKEWTYHLRTEVRWDALALAIDRRELLRLVNLAPDARFA